MSGAPDTSTMVPPSSIRTILHQVLPWLEKTLSERGYTNWTLETLVEDLMTGRKQLWAAKENGAYLFAVTQTWQEVKGLHVDICLGGGSLDPDHAVIKHIGLIEQWARNIGAVSLTVSGRKGWERLLKPYGYQFEFATYRRTFSERMN